MAELRTLTVLYLHYSDAFGGASKSLCEMIGAMPAGAIRAIVLSPAGSAAERFGRVAARVETVAGVPKWDHTRFSFYRRQRWLLLLREALFFLPAWRTARKLVREERPDVVHANDITGLYFAARVARRFGVPLVVHARSLQNDDQDLRRTRWQNELLRTSNATVIAIDETVRRTLPAEIHVNVVHNGLQVKAIVMPDADVPRRFRVAIIGVLLRLKGVFEFVEAARRCIELGMDAEFWIVGEHVREVSGLSGQLFKMFGFAEDVRAGLVAEIERHGLQERVKLLGFVEDVASIYRQIDVLCFPSHLDAAGRPVFEAAWFGVPSVVAVRSPLPDTISHGQSGLCIDASDPAQLTGAICRLYKDPDERRRLGEGARHLAHKYFDQRQNSRSVLDLYRTLVGNAGSNGPVPIQRKVV